MPGAFNADGVSGFPQRLYEMDTIGEDTQAVRQPGGQGTPARPGRSGEGSRSALEHLVQQEKKRRDAQLLREGGGNSGGGEAGRTP
jgi:hypothetical protein